MMLRLLAFILCLSLPSAGRADDIFWSYDGIDDGQQVWGSLSHLFAACEFGKRQSPVNLVYAKRSFKPPLVFSYRPVSAEAHYDGRTVTLTLKENTSLSSEAVDYVFTSLSFHSPSEHEVNGESYPLEIEMLHENKKGQRLMLSVFADTGAANAAIDAIFKGTALESGSATKVRFDPAALLPTDRHYYAYSGSLTHPPCTEDVEWRILKTPITVSQEQFKTIAAITGRNARLTQPIYLRELEETGR